MSTHSSINISQRDWVCFPWNIILGYYKFGYLRQLSFFKIFYMIVEIMIIYALHTNPPSQYTAFSSFHNNIPSHQNCLYFYIFHSMHHFSLSIIMLKFQSVYLNWNKWPLIDQIRWVLKHICIFEQEIFVKLIGCTFGDFCCISNLGIVICIMGLRCLWLGRGLFSGIRHKQTFYTTNLFSIYTLLSNN